MDILFLITTIWSRPTQDCRSFTKTSVIRFTEKQKCAKMGISFYRKELKDRTIRELLRLLPAAGSVIAAAAGSVIAAAAELTW